MVLFNEAEATLLLDLYLHFRSSSQNLTSGGVLLKMHARDELTRAMNRYFPRDAPWTESQVTVKFKNLRSEYIELKWLTDQPGFQLDGRGLTDDWWGDIKARRPKVHAFKGKLPWPFYKKMGVIVGDLPATTNVTDARSMQRITQLLTDTATANGHAKSYSSSHSPHQQSTTSNGSANGSVTNANANGVPTTTSTATPSATSTNPPTAVDLVARPTATPFQQLHPQPPQQLLPAKRPRDSSAGKRPRKRVSDLAPDERARQQSLVGAVEHGAKAAADMARGFTELIAVYQQQVTKCGQAEHAAAAVAGGNASGNSPDESLNVPEQLQILASLAAALEKSAQATAEIATGYRDLVAFFIQENDDAAATP